MLKNRLKELRKRENITQVQFAKIFDISPGTIAMWETGKREPDIDTLIRIADYFNVSVDYLLGKSENKKILSANTDKEELSADEQKLLNYFRELNEEGQYILINQAQALATSGLYIKNKESEIHSENMA